MLEAREQLRQIETGSIQWLESGDGQDVLDRIQARAGYPVKEGYRDDVESISLEDFRREIRRGVYGG